MKIGYDLDGVICKEPNYISKAFKFSVNLGIKLRQIQDRLYIPKIPGFIITGRPKCDSRLTIRWLMEKGISYEELFMPNVFINSMQATIFKSAIINNLDCDYYIESDMYISLVLDKLCPNCNVINVKNKLATYFLWG